MEKVRTRIGGKQVRAIRGIRLRTDADSSETIEEILSLSFQGHSECDSQSDRISDNGCDNLEPLENQGCDKCDHLFLSNEKKDFEKEITAQSEIFPNLSDQTHSPVTAESNQGVEAVTEAVATSVTTPVTPQPAKTPVSEIKAEMLACQHSGSVKAFWSKYSGREAQVYRAIAAFTPEEERAWAAAEKRPATRLAKKQVKRVKRAMVACRNQQQTAKVRQDYGDWAVKEVLAHYMSNDEKVTWRAASAQSTFLL